MSKLPEILIVGAQKAGTSSLFRALAAHPDIQVARDLESGDERKELHFFNNTWDRGPEWYAGHYASGPERGIDATPNYLSSLYAHPRMAEVLPDARVIVSLRDPVSRAFSQYNHYKQALDRSRGWDWLLPHADFDANVKEELRSQDILERRFRGLVARGYYVDQIESLLKYYDREQLHIIVMERWSRDPAAAAGALLRFLCLPEADLAIGLAHNREYSVETMLPTTRKLLKRRYRPYNERLFSLLGAEIEEWA